MTDKQIKTLSLPVIICALGYFVDLYDLLLFSVVRSKSLIELGVAQEQLLPVGLNLISWMLGGMLIGGIIWGILGDKKGRVTILFGSILLYSIANIANGFIESVEAYRILRFIAGVGLAGELGAGITLISEIMKPDKRGIGTMIMASVGMLGAVAASVIGESFHWRTAYIIGGVMGLTLLVLRMKILESKIFIQSLENKNLNRGNFLKIFTSKTLFIRYLKYVFFGLPVFFVIGILITGAPEFGKEFGMPQLPSAGIAVMITYLSISLADVVYSVLSQILQSRKKPLYISIPITLTGMILYLFFPSMSLEGYYFRCFILGFGIGFWAVIMTSIAEQFGTNLRATVTTTIPNFMRGLLIPLSVIFQMIKPNLGLVNSAAVVGISSVIISFFILLNIKETFGRSLDFYDE